MLVCESNCDGKSSDFIHSNKHSTILTYEKVLFHYPIFTSAWIPAITPYPLSQSPFLPFPRFDPQTWQGPRSQPSTLSPSSHANLPSYLISVVIHLLLYYTLPSLLHLLFLLHLILSLALQISPFSLHPIDAAWELVVHMTDLECVSTEWRMSWNNSIFYAGMS